MQVSGASNGDPEEVSRQVGYSLHFSQTPSHCGRDAVHKLCQTQEVQQRCVIIMVTYEDSDYQNLPIVHIFLWMKYRFVADIWLDLVVPSTKASLGVQSWLNGGADDLKSTCTPQGSVSILSTDIRFRFHFIIICCVSCTSFICRSTTFLRSTFWARGSLLPKITPSGQSVMMPECLWSVWEI